MFECVLLNFFIILAAGNIRKQTNLTYAKHLKWKMYVKVTKYNFAIMPLMAIVKIYKHHFYIFDFRKVRLVRTKVADRQTTHRETDKLIAIGDILQICLKKYVHIVSVPANFPQQLSTQSGVIIGTAAGDATIF